MTYIEIDDSVTAVAKFLVKNHNEHGQKNYNKNFHYEIEISFSLQGKTNTKVF